MSSVSKVYLRVVRGLALLSAVAVFTKCASDQPTETSEGPSQVIREYDDNAGCATEVIDSTSDSTQVLIVTFTTPENNCYPQLAQWGIDMADPVGVDTPQGNAFVQIYSGAFVVNNPSPPYAARGGHYTPSQFMIEFDPPVRSVEFDYSVLQGSRAIWNGQWDYDTDSIPVYARSRIPGTTSYTTWDYKVLHANVPSTTPPWNSWTHVKFQSGSSDKIQWLWFNGGEVVFDDFKIVRKPLTCTSPVQRGSNVRCEVSGNLTVTGWEFQPDTTPGMPTLPAVQDSSGSAVWQGSAAIGGTVTAHVTNGTTQQAMKAQFTVSNRPSTWSTTWNYRVGPELTAPDAEPGLGVTLGRNCPEISGVALCVPTLRVQPDPTQLPGEGNVITRILTGPNTGYFYVAAISYEMRRVGNLNPGVLANSSRTHPLPASIPKQCRQALGFGPKDPVFANFNLYNDKCKKLSMTVFVGALYGHEGLGYGGGQGHESLARTAASETQNDPYAALEKLVFADSTSLELEADSRVAVIGEDITVRAADPNPTGNYSTGPMWFWDAGSSSFVLTTISGF